MSAQILEQDWLDEVSAPVNRGGRPRKDGSGRMRKVACMECGFGLYATAGAVERAGGFPTCVCGGAMTWANARDQLDHGREDLAPETHNALCREAGRLADQVETEAQLRRRARSSRVTVRQCAAGGCTKFTGGREYCAEHDTMAREGSFTPARRSL